MLPSFLKKTAETGIKSIVFLSLDVGLPKNMWGLHAAMLVYFMSVFSKGVIERKSKNSYYKRYNQIVEKWEAVFEKFS